MQRRVKIDSVVRGEEADGGLSLDEISRSEESKDGSTSKPIAIKKSMRQSKTLL